MRHLIIAFTLLLCIVSSTLSIRVLVDAAAKYQGPAEL